MHAKCASDLYKQSLCPPLAGRQKAKKKGKKRSAAEAGLADDSAEAALAALLAGPYARSDEEWAGEVGTQCAAVGLLDTVLEVSIGCLVGQDGGLETDYKSVMLPKHALACAIWCRERRWGCLAPSWKWTLARAAKEGDCVTSIPPEVIRHGYPTCWWAALSREGRSYDAYASITGA